VTDKVIGKPSGDLPASAPSPSQIPLEPAQDRPVQPPEASTALLAIGSKLAAARQAQGVSLEALANRLHLGVSQLQALECGDLSRLPEGVFVIAYARRIAESLGIPIDDELSALRGRPQDRGSRSPSASVSRSEHSGVPRSAVTRSAPPRVAPTPVLPWRAALLTLGLLGLAGLAFALRPWSRPQPLSGVPTPPAPTAAQPKPSPVDPPQRLPEKRQVPAATTAPGIASPGASSIPSSGLVLRSDPASWVSVRDQSGKVLFEGLLSGEQRFPLALGLEVLAGRPDLVRASVKGGEARPLGTISDVKWNRFPATSALPRSEADQVQRSAPQPQGPSPNP
jgi:cytoskeletal protein RodZ